MSLLVWLSWFRGECTFRVRNGVCLHPFRPSFWGLPGLPFWQAPKLSKSHNFSKLAKDGPSRFRREKIPAEYFLLKTENRSGWSHYPDKKETPKLRKGESAFLIVGGRRSGAAAVIYYLVRTRRMTWIGWHEVVRSGRNLVQGQKIALKTIGI